MSHSTRSEDEPDQHPFLFRNRHGGLPHFWDDNGCARWDSPPQHSIGSRPDAHTVVVEGALDSCSALAAADRLMDRCDTMMAKGEAMLGDLDKVTVAAGPDVADLPTRSRVGTRSRQHRDQSTRGMTRMCHQGFVPSRKSRLPQ
jgi:hypothetical protein